MLDRTVTFLMLVLALIHLLPFAGFLGPERIIALYQVVLTDRNLEILMRHRAVLFALLGGFIAYAAFVPALQAAALWMVGISIVSFLYLAISLGEYNDAIGKVVIADLIALACLLIILALRLLKRFN